MLRLLLAFFLLSVGAAHAEEGFLPYDSDVALSGIVAFKKHSTPLSSDEAAYDYKLKLDKAVAVGGTASDFQNGGTFLKITSMQIIPHSEIVAARLRAFAKSRVNVRGWLSKGDATDVALTVTEVEPVKANGSP